MYVNPQFYFPKVIQLQTTILPAIGQFGGDEFERAKHMYEFLKSQGPRGGRHQNKPTD